MANSSTDLSIHTVALEDLDTGLALIWDVFLKFVAPDYSKEAIDFFYSQYITGARFRQKFFDGSEVMYGAYICDELVGVLSISARNTVSCIFVKEEYHRMGIGKSLFDAVIKELKRRGVAEINLNASPYAINFYHKLGFCDTDVQSTYNGMIYTPMKLALDEYK